MALIASLTLFLIKLSPRLTREFQGTLHTERLSYRIKLVSIMLKYFTGKETVKEIIAMIQSGFR